MAAEHPNTAAGRVGSKSMNYVKSESTGDFLNLFDEFCFTTATNSEHGVLVGGNDV